MNVTPDATGPVPVVLIERRTPFDILMALLTGACVLAAVRGRAQAPGLAAAAAGLAVLLLATWVHRRRKPAARLSIGPDAISLARGSTVEVEGRRTTDERVRISRGRSGAFLSVPGPTPAVINLMGFDLREVAEACHRTGWAPETARGDA